MDNAQTARKELSESGLLASEEGLPRGAADLESPRSFQRAPEPPSSRLVTVGEFAELYAACAFATKFGMALDTSVTVTWSLLGRETEKDVIAGFNALTKCVRDWLSERGLPTAFIYGHERGRRTGLHTHIAIFIPGIPVGSTVRSGWTHRRDFRRYMQNWGQRHAGGPAPRAIRVRGSSAETPWLTWRLMNYIVKGFDRSAVVQSAEYSPDRRTVYLGDLISRTWADPGVVTLPKRVGVSRSLGPDRRAQGYPSAEFRVHAPGVRPTLAADFEVMGSKKRWWECNSYSAARPFRSAFEDGIRDVRQLYPADFVRMVTKLEPEGPRPITSALDDDERTRQLLSSLQI